jgi:hypothetical protein
LILALILVARRFDAISNPQFWGEDGTIFFRENLIYGFWYSLGNFYRGSPYLLQRLVAAAATPFGIANAPLVYNLTAITVVSAASAFFSLPHFRHIVRSDYLRILFCIAVVSLPDSQELVGTLTNVHWYLAIWALLVSIMKLPVSWWGNALLLGAYAICVASAPIVLITAPIWLVRLVSAAAARRFLEAVVSLAALALMATTLVITKGVGVEPGAAVELRGFLDAFVNFVAVRIVAQALIGTERAVEIAAANSWLLYLMAGLAIAFAVGLSVLGRFKNLLVLLICCYAVLSSIFIMMLGRSDMIAFGRSPTASLTAFWTVAETHALTGGRYFVLGIAMVYLVFISAVDRLPAGTVKIVATTALLCQLVNVLLQSFVLIPFVDHQWQQYAGQLSSTRVQRGEEVLVIPLNPRPSYIVFGDNARLSKISESTVGLISNVDGISMEESQGVPISVPADRPIEITGWAIDTVSGAPARAVAVKIDNQQQVWAHYGLRRPDVAAVLENPTYEMSGFSATIPALTPGLHTLELTIVTADGLSYYKPDHLTQHVKVQAR